MSTFDNVNFSGATAGADLNTLTGSAGETYARHSSYSTGAAVVTAGGRVRLNSVNVVALYYGSGAPAGSDYTVQATLYYAGFTGYSAQVGLVLDVATGADSYYRFVYVQSPATGWIAYKNVAGSITQISSLVSATLTAGQSYNLQAQAQGSTITFSVGGATVMTVSKDPAIPSGGRAGMLFFDTVANTDSTGLQFANFSASDLGSTSYTLTGPSSGITGVASSPFTVTPNANYTGTINPNDGGAGGTFSPTSLTWSGTAQAKTFTYTAATGGSKTIATTSAPALTNPSPLTYVAGGGTIAVTSPQAYLVRQQNGGVANLPISGTYAGTPTGIEASYNGAPYQTIATNLSGGTFAGTLANLPTGQGTLTVRAINDVTINVSIPYVGIGDVFVVYGQSNAVGQATNNQVYRDAIGLKACLFGFDYVRKELADPTHAFSGTVDSVPMDSTLGGSAWPLLATLMMARLRYPVAFIPAAQDGAAIATLSPSGSGHLDRTTCYGAMNYRGQNYGSGGVKAVLYWQGESDAMAGASQSAYLASLTALASAIKADLGSPLIVCKLLSLATSFASAANQAAIRAAIDQAWQAGTVLPGPDLGDVAADTVTGNGVHAVSDNALAVIGARWWDAIRKAIYDPSASTGRRRGIITGGGL